MSGYSVPRLKQLDTGTLSMSTLVGVGEPADKEYVIANVNCRAGWG